MIVLLLALLGAAAALPPPPTPDPTQCDIPNNAGWFDCFPDGEVTQESCEVRGCCWGLPKLRSDQPGVPFCYYPKGYGGYRSVNWTGSIDGQLAFLERTFQSAYPRDVELLRLEVEYQTNDRVRVKITDAQNERYETIYPKIPKWTGTADQPNYSVDFDYLIAGFQVKRSNGDVLFDTQELGGFIFADHFIQLSSKYSGLMYGLGEHRTNLHLDSGWARYTMFNYWSDPKENINMYGSHPFYLVVEPNGVSHGVYLHNSNAMDVLLQPLDAVTFRALGGVLDFYFFMGPTPADVIKQYTELVGRPFLPPYWSLGFHLCRYNYNSANNTRAAWQRTVDAGIPFDTQWNDIDLMITQNDFTIDPDRFAEIFDLVDDIHAAGMHYVVILDPGVSAGEPAGSYPPYDDGLDMDIFVKDRNGSVFIGKVWNPESTAFVDFTHPRALEYWSKQAKSLHDRLEFDGLWIDMNEPASFMDGGFDGCPDDELENPQYHSGVWGDKLYGRTICMTTRQHAGQHYDVHNIYGISSAEVTNLAVREVVQKRPFVLSRSTFAGAGAYTGHWSGDNWSSWYDLDKSVAEILQNSLFGISLSGADICGHNDNATPELCNRWMQLGAFYSFSRNHATAGSSDQDPVSLGPLVVESSKKALTIRYTLLPYLYTLMYRASVYGETVARPVFFEFPEDANTHRLDKSFMWGSGLYVIPVTKENATTVSTYLPSGRWYDWYTSLAIESTGGNLTFMAPLDTIPLLVRGGVILPTQAPAVTTTLSRKNGFTFLVALNNKGEASGSLYWDEGDSMDPIENNEFGLLELSVSLQHLSSTVTQWNTKDTPVTEGVTVWGVTPGVTKVTVNGEEVPFTLTADNVLTVTGLKIALNEKLDLIWE